MSPVPVLTPEQSAAWDARAEAAGIALATLMDAAGRAAAEVMVRHFRDRARIGVLVAAGTGNNGGDGWVIARVMHRAGIPVWVVEVPGKASDLQRRVAELARREGVRTVAADGPWPTVGLVVDAILGTGARGAPRPPVPALLERLAELRVPLAAVDGPTGLDLGTGAAYHPVPAALTVTFGGFRRGHLMARDDVGHVIVVDIGHPPAEPGWPQVVTDPQAAAWLPRLRAADHKGIRGRVVVIGGSTGMTGAIRMSGRAAFGAGAGLVHAVAPADTVAALVTAEPDLQTLPHPLAAPLDQKLIDLLERADAVVVGPGLGRDQGRRELVNAVAPHARRLVLDADALTVFQGQVPELAAIAAGRPLVLTPHPGEFRTLFPGPAGRIESDPWGAAAQAAEECGAVVVLKGVPSVIATPSAGAVYTIAAGNPGLATGGSGDLLSGFTGAALARDLDPAAAAALAAQILGRAADLAARRVSPRSMRPMDVLAALPQLWRGWDLLGSAAPTGVMVLAELERPVE